MKKKFTYSEVGDNYDSKDPVLKLSLVAAKETSGNLKLSGFNEMSLTRGQSAFVWDQGDCYMAQVLECLGTKNLIADEMGKLTGKSYYNIIAHDTVATFINDLATVGAKPLVVNAYWAIEDNSWFGDIQRAENFISGWRDACNLAGATWGGGETPTLKGIINSNTVDLAGSVTGIIKPKSRFISDKKLKIGDRIIMLKSNGPNANGISLARAVGHKLKSGYNTKLTSGKLYGEEILQKTNIYAKLVQDLLDVVDIHYIVNITGHGVRKIMRANKNYSYVLENLFEEQEVFRFIQKNANISDYEMYQTYNMGMDYAIFLEEKDVETALKIIKRHKLNGLNAGYVGKGPRRVEIHPKNIIFESKTYQIH